MTRVLADDGMCLRDFCHNGSFKLAIEFAKPGHKLKVGDKITVEFGNRSVSVRVMKLMESVKKEEADSMYEVVEE